MKYDVFISYRSVNEAWVAVLAKNLKQCGLVIFLDRWHIRPGDNIDIAIGTAISESSAAVIVDTPESRESKYMWEYEYRAILSQSIWLIPIHFGNISDTIVKRGLLGVDFSDPSDTAYHRAFRILLNGLRGNAPGEEPPPLPDNCNLIIPDPIDADPNQLPDTPLVGTNFHIVDDIFSSLKFNIPVAVFAQDGWDRSIIHRSILQNAPSNNYSRVVHLVAPLYKGITEKQYFAEVNRKLDMPADPDGCYMGIEELVRADDSKLLMLITRIEHGNDDCRNELASVLRGVSEEMPGHFRVVLCGAERLAKLCNPNDQNSLLGSAHRMLWRDPTLEDLLAWQNECYPTETQISEHDGQYFLSLCGGNPRLLQEALILRHKGITLTQIRDRLAYSDTLVTTFTACLSLPSKDQERICEWLRCEQLAEYNIYPIDEVLRCLFWRNLLMPSACQRYFQWRCPLVQEVGLRVLKG